MNFLPITDLRGGRNGVDDPLDPKVPKTQCHEAINVTWEDGATVGGRRGGCTSLSLTGGSTFSSVWSLQRHMPAELPTQELWAFGLTGGATSLVKRMAGGTAFADITMDDALLVDGSYLPYVKGVSFNGKFFICYRAAGAVGRLHCFDPSLSSPRVRRVGINPGVTAPTAANTGGGAWPPTAAYYRVRFAQVDGSRLVRSSEPTPSVSFTPSGAGLATRVTRPTAPGEGETTWVLEKSDDNVTFYRIIDAPIATTFLDDSTSMAVYKSTGTLSEVLGTFTLPPSAVDILVVDNNRLLMVGDYEGTPTGGTTTRVYHTPVLGSAIGAADERVADLSNRKPYTALGNGNGGATIGIAGPIEGYVYVFKYKEIWRGMPTGDLDVPYIWRRVTNTVGAMSNKAITLGEDEQGRPCIYFASYQGVYRIGPSGLQYMGRDNEDIWVGGDPMFLSYGGINLDPAWISSFLIWNGQRKSLECYITNKASSTTACNLRLTLFVRNILKTDQWGVRGGWAVNQVRIGQVAVSACMFSSTPGATMSREESIYESDNGGKIQQLEILTAGTDDGTAFVPFLATRNILNSDALGKQYGIGEVLVHAPPLAAAEVSLSLLYDGSRNSQTSLLSLAKTAEETSAIRIVRKVGNSGYADMALAQYIFTDSINTPGVRWRIKALMPPITNERDS